jgi:hypothetical protein
VLEQAAAGDPTRAGLAQTSHEEMHTCTQRAVSALRLGRDRAGPCVSPAGDAGASVLVITCSTVIFRGAAGRRGEGSGCGFPIAMAAAAMAHPANTAPVVKVAAVAVGDERGCPDVCAGGRQGCAAAVRLAAV